MPVICIYVCIGSYYPTGRFASYVSCMGIAMTLLTPKEVQLKLHESGIKLDYMQVVHLINYRVLTPDENGVKEYIDFAQNHIKCKELFSLVDWVTDETKHGIFRPFRAERRGYYKRKESLAKIEELKANRENNKPRYNWHE